MPDDAFQIRKHSYPVNDPLTDGQYEKGLRDPYWFATLISGDKSRPEIFYYNHPFYKWCVERGINIEVRYLYNCMHAYIQDPRLALEAKITFG